MINLLVAYDNQDFKLGTYFEKSFQKFLDRLESESINILPIDGENCTSDVVEKKISKFDGSNFIFVGFSHGSDGGLHTSSDNYIVKERSVYFAKSFFYTTACSSSRELAPSLLDGGCFAFIGYDDEIHIHPDYHDDFIDCEIHAIVEFFNSEKTIGEVYDDMHSKFEEVIVRLLGGTIADTVVASTLVDNQQQLRIYGNENLTIADFHII